VADPCVGQGVALNLIAQGANVRRYGVELDAERALAASATGIETIQGASCKIPPTADGNGDFPLWSGIVSNDR
jgi:hypothetical protein